MSQLGTPTPPERMIRKGFRPHPFTLTLAHSLFPTAGTNTVLFHTLLTEALQIPLPMHPSPEDLALLHEKILHLERSTPQKTLVSKGSDGTANRYPTVSLYLTHDMWATVEQYISIFPLFNTCNLVFKHALFTNLLYRGISFQEVIHHFTTPRLATAARTHQGSSRDPFITQRAAGLLAQKAVDPTTGEQPTLPESVDLTTGPSPEEILSHLEDLLTPPLQVPTEEQLTNLRKNISKGQSHSLFPHTEWDYTPILEKALTISQGQLSSTILQLFTAPTERGKRTIKKRTTPEQVSA